MKSGSISCFALSMLMLLGCGGGSKDASSGSTAPKTTDPSTGPAVPGQQVKQVLTTPIDTNIGGYLEYVPGDYATTTRIYPLMIFCHGLGELGTGSSTDLDKVAVNGPPKLIKNNQFPAGFTVNGGTYSFIVISPQFKQWPSNSNIKALLDHLKGKGLRFDPTRVYLTGLSMGGGITWTAGSDATVLPSLAAILPICGAAGSDPAGAKRVADAKLPVWALHNDQDPTVTVSNTNNWVTEINNNAPTIPARKTIFVAASHDAWSKAYDPNYREMINGQNMNVYEWMLSYKK
jgi:predicted peptidase